MTPEQQIEQIELSIEQAKGSISNMDALARLTENKDFKQIVIEGFFEKEASRVVLLKADPNMQDGESQQALDRAITAIGEFRQYLRTINQLGSMARKALNDHEEARTEILDEAVEV